MTRKPIVELDTPTSVEKLRAYIETTADPTGDTVEWQLTAVGTAPAAGSWSAGSWVGSWDAGHQRAQTSSPLVVSELGAVTGEHYDVYVRWTVGSETPEHYAGRLRVS